MTVELYLGDCLDILPTLADQSVNAIITDLPYGTTACKWDTVIPFEPMWAQVRRLLKPRGAFVTTASQPFTSMLVMSNLEWFRYELIWYKTMPLGYLDANRKPLKTHENILVFGDGQLTYNPQWWYATPYARLNKIGAATQYHWHPRIDSKSVDGKRYPISVIKFSNGNHDSQHPTQKSVALYEYLVRTYTNEGDIVLDFCMGSGTTGEACIKTGRNFVGIEIMSEYFEIAKRRIEQAQQQMRLPLAA